MVNSDQLCFKAIEADFFYNGRFLVPGGTELNSEPLVLKPTILTTKPPPRPSLGTFLM